jgi:hypothetical protein
LSQGGNGIDAAIATSFVACCIEPCNATLGGRDNGQLNEGAEANQYLSPKGIGLRQHPLSIAVQVDASGFTQIGDPRLEVVRIRCQQCMGEHEAPHVGFAIRAAPGSDGSFWEFITAAGQRSGGREYCTAAHKTYEGTAAGGG